MLEVKTDALEASFEAFEREEEDVALLRGEVALLKARVDAQAIAGARPALSGAKSEASPFVERYLRKGLEAGVELKAVSGATDAAGGYAVPQEIDAEIDKALTAISPIRAIANVVKVGSAGYRKLVTTGGTSSTVSVRKTCRSRAGAHSPASHLASADSARTTGPSTAWRNRPKAARRRRSATRVWWMPMGRRLSSTMARYLRRSA